MSEPVDQVLALRRQGLSFGAIATATGLTSSREAYHRYRTDLGRLPSDERTEVLLEEEERLETLRTRLAERADLDDVERAPRLAALTRLRHELLQAGPD